MSSGNVKQCGRCEYIWTSNTDNPIRCPKCGTTHWKGDSRSFNCAVCNHVWFSRTNNKPARCPKCKTRSWYIGEPVETVYDVDLEDPDVNRIIDMYSDNKGCISIAMETNIPLSKVITTVKATMPGHYQPYM